MVGQDPPRTRPGVQRRAGAARFRRCQAASIQGIHHEQGPAVRPAACSGYPPAFATECNSANTIRGAGTVAVLIGSNALTLADSDTRINNYAVELGEFDRFASICVVGTEPTTLVFDLSGSGSDYVFEDIRFGFPRAFAPSDSPFKPSVIGTQTITVTFQGSKATLGQTSKYDLILRNTRTSERLVIDPPIVNSPN